MSKRTKMLEVRRKAWAYAEREWSGVGATWSGEETRRLMSASWLAGYNAALRKPRKRRRSAGEVRGKKAKAN